MRITSPAFRSQGEIPSRYTAEGANVSPPLHFDVTSKGVKSLALVVDDPDAASGSWTHWILFNLPPSTTDLPEGKQGPLPPEAREGKNSWGGSTYNGPAPPSGRHRYVFTLFALDRVLDLDNPSKEQLEKAMTGHVLAAAQLVGTYELQYSVRPSAHY